LTNFFLINQLGQSFCPHLKKVIQWGQILIWTQIMKEVVLNLNFTLAAKLNVSIYHNTCKSSQNTNYLTPFLWKLIATHSMSMYAPGRYVSTY
jgi:hypothetical protein